MRPPALVRTIPMAMLVLACAGLSTPSASGAPLDASDNGLTVTALTSYSTRLTWTAPALSAQVQISRGGRLIDETPTGGSSTYTDYLLWQSTMYSYQATFLDQNGSVLSTASASVTTLPQVGPFPRLYASTSFWNTKIAKNASIDPASSAMIAASFLPWRDKAPIDNDDGWGIPIAYADPSSHVYDVGCTKYNCQIPASFPIPRYAQANLGSNGNWDGHLVVYNPTTNHELDMWEGAYDPDLDAWSASSRYDTVADIGTRCEPGQHCAGGGVAAGFDQFGGVIRPEEIAQGHIDHALVIASPYIRYNYISCPATNIWASQSPGYVNDPNAVPLGAHIRLARSVHIDAKPWAQWEKVVAHALQDYGAYVVDIGETIAVRGEANLDRGYDAWSLVGLTTTPHPSLSNLPWGKMRVLTLQPC